MTADISTVIMTHPDRLPAAEKLRDDHPELGARIVVDPEPDGPPTTLRTARLAWAAVAPGATHHLLLQEDVVLTEGFADHLRAAVTARPDDALGLFCMWGTRNSYAVRLAALLGGALVENASRYVPTQALVVPAPVALEIAEYLRTEVHIGQSLLIAGDEEDDMAIQRCLRRSGIAAYVTVASLVDHVSRTSLLGHPTPQPSACFFDRLADAPDWSAAPLRFDCVPYISWDNYRALCRISSTGVLGEQTITTEDYLASTGFSPNDVATALLTYLDQSEERARAARRIGFALCHTLWITACALGLVFTAAARGRQLEQALADPIAVRALSTLVPGALCQLVWSDELTAAADVLHRLVLDGVRHGASMR